MQLSPIEWTNYTANPLKYRDQNGNAVHACIHKSTGCLHCYAETLAPRWGRAGKKFTVGNMENLTPFLDEKELHHMLTCKPAAGKMCFVGDMTDIFGEWVPDELLDKLFAVFALRPDITWQILTKRPERMLAYLRGHPIIGMVSAAMTILGTEDIPFGRISQIWPLHNVWLGVSVENQQYADERIPLLLQTAAAKRFVSYEPALSAINFGRIEVNPPGSGGTVFIDALKGTGCSVGGNWKYIPLDWVIVGGESGPGARPFAIQWARSVVSECKAVGVACFVKQLGSSPYSSVRDSVFKLWRLEDGPDAFDAGPFYAKLKSSKGGDMSEWPEDLRVRQFPGSG